MIMIIIKLDLTIKETEKSVMTSYVRNNIFIEIQNGVLFLLYYSNLPLIIIYAH